MKIDQIQEKLIDPNCSPNVLKAALALPTEKEKVQKLLSALQEIEHLGYGLHTTGYSCANIAANALKEYN